MSKTLLVLAATSTGGLNFFRSIVTFSRGSRPRFLRRGISMSGENSCFSRFLVKFVEVSAAGLATAISAYALAHLGGLLPSSTTPTSAPATAVQVSPTASEVAERLRAKPTPPAAAGAVNLRSSRTPMRPSRSPRVRPRRTRKHCRRASTQKPIRAWPRRSLAARHRRKPWPGPHSPMSTPIGRHQMTR